MKSQFFQSSRFYPTDGRFLPSDLDQQWSTFSQCRGEARRVPASRPPTQLLLFSSASWTQTLTFPLQSESTRTQGPHSGPCNIHTHTHTPTCAHSHNKDTFRPVWTREHWPAVVCLLHLQLLRGLVRGRWWLFTTHLERRSWYR